MIIIYMMILIIFNKIIMKYNNPLINNQFRDNQILFNLNNSINHNKTLSQNKIFIKIDNHSMKNKFLVIR